MFKSKPALIQLCLENLNDDSVKLNFTRTLVK